MESKRKPSYANLRKSAEKALSEASRKAKSDEYTGQRFQLQKRVVDTEITSRRVDIALRKKLSGRVFWLTVAWLCSMQLLVLFEGFRLLSFQLSDTVLLTLIGSTTASIVGLLAWIVRYVFILGASGLVADSASTEKPTPLD